MDFYTIFAHAGYWRESITKARLHRFTFRKHPDFQRPVRAKLNKISTEVLHLFVLILFLFFCHRQLDVNHSVQAATLEAYVSAET